MYPDEGKTQGNCTQTNLKQHLTFIKTTNRMGSSLKTHVHTHTTNKTEEQRGSPTDFGGNTPNSDPCQKMFNFYDAVKITFSLLCAHIVF